MMMSKRREKVFQLVKMLISQIMIRVTMTKGPVTQTAAVVKIGMKTAMTLLIKEIIECSGPLATESIKIFIFKNMVNFDQFCANLDFQSKIGD